MQWISCSFLFLFYTCPCQLHQSRGEMLQMISSFPSLHCSFALFLSLFSHPGLIKSLHLRTSRENVINWRRLSVTLFHYITPNQMSCFAQCALCALYWIKPTIKWNPGFITSQFLGIVCVNLSSSLRWFIGALRAVGYAAGVGSRVQEGHLGSHGWGEGSGRSGGLRCHPRRPQLWQLLLRYQHLLLIHFSY